MRRYRDPAAADRAAAHGGGGGRVGVQATPAHPRAHGQVRRAAGAAPQGTYNYILNINNFTFKQDKIDGQLQLKCTLRLRSK